MKKEKKINNKKQKKTKKITRIFQFIAKTNDSINFAFEKSKKKNETNEKKNENKIF